MQRFEGHQVSGYPIGFDISRNGEIICTGSASGEVVFYNWKSSRIIQKVKIASSVCVDSKYHPVLSSIIACCCWNGRISILGNEQEMYS